ncbi:MAG: glycosyltransferase family 39 protein, partial [Bryobacterales bacterium]|nr:glycosyltransferase family 39 protein [Bryobacterales bacterium]
MVPRLTTKAAISLGDWAIPLGALAACAFAFGMGLSYLPLAGLQHDEILFLHPFLFDWVLFRARVEQTNIPLMVMSYVGALKTWLYWPLYTYLPPSVWTIRLPMLLLATVNVWLLYRLGKRLWDPRAGRLAAALAATDPTLLLTQIFDWGPVTLQNSLSLGAMLLFLRWLDHGARRWLALCCFCCGLALWNKAIFAWLLVAAPVACALTWPHLLHPKRWMVFFRSHALAAVGGVTAFALGAAPLLYYNWREASVTVRQNARFESTFPTLKLYTLAGSLDGYLIGSDVGLFSIWERACTVGRLAPETPPPALPGALQWLPWSTWTTWLLAGALLVSLWFWRRPQAAIVRALLLTFVIYCGLAMALVNGGTGIHHYVPLLPALFLAIGGAWSLLDTQVRGKSRSRAAPPLAGLLAALAILVVLQSALTIAAWQQRAA